MNWQSSLASASFVFALLFGSYTLTAISEMAFAESDQLGAQDHYYVIYCASCHGEKLSGAFAPSLRGEAFFTKWRTKGKTGLIEYVARSMPPSDPGGLSSDTYNEIVSFI